MKYLKGLQNTIIDNVYLYYISNKKINKLNMILHVSTYLTIYNNISYPFVNLNDEFIRLYCQIRNITKGQYDKETYDKCMNFTKPTYLIAFDDKDFKIKNSENKQRAKAIDLGGKTKRGRPIAEIEPYVCIRQINLTKDDQMTMNINTDKFIKDFFIN
jgi:hypothetical protein